MGKKSLCQSRFELILKMPQTTIMSLSRPIRQDSYDSHYLLLALTFVTPPFPDVNCFQGTLWCWQIVVRTLFDHKHVKWAIQCDEWEVRQVNLMNLIEDILARNWINCLLFLRIEGIQRFVTVEVNVETIRRFLIAGEHQRVISVVVERVLELCNVICTRFSIGQE